MIMGGSLKAFNLAPAPNSAVQTKPINNFATKMNFSILYDDASSSIHDLSVNGGLLKSFHVAARVPVFLHHFNDFLKSRANMIR